MKLILKVLVFIAATYTACAQCNTCSSTTGLACVANDQFKVCVNGVPSSMATQCPSGTLCSATGPICSPAGSVTPACSRCWDCNGSKTFACTGLQTYALCYGTDNPDNVDFECSDTTVCNVDSPLICVDPVATGLGGTCPSVTTTTTTTTTTAAPPNPATNPQGYCASVAVYGRYDITSDVNCKTYVFCSKVNGAWIGVIYECPGTTQFFASSQQCATGIPPRCV